MDNKAVSQDRPSENQENDAVKIKLFKDLQYNVIDGVNYICALETSDMREVYPLIKKLILRNDDILMMGYPKSGNHWTFEIIGMILHQGTDFVDTLMANCFIEYQGVDVQRKLDAMQSPRVLGTHIRSYRIPEEVAERRIKIVYPIRNVKDVAVSMYNMCRASTDENNQYNATFDEFFQQFITGQFLWGHWFDHILAMEDFTKEHPDHPIHVVSYERMKTSPVEVIKELCAFLGKSDAIADGIAQNTEISNMKKVLMSGKEGRFHEGKMTPNAIFRKGVIGDWKQWLSESQSKALDDLFEMKMSGSKLAQLTKEYM